MSHNAMKTMKGIQRSFELKDDKIEEPDTCLGAGLSKMTTANGTVCWSMLSEAYCKVAVKNVEQKLSEDGKRLPSKCDTPMKSAYQREQERRRICDFITTDRRDCPEQKISTTSRKDQHKVHRGRIKLDSHANTIVFGKNYVVLAFTGRECDVSPYTDAYSTPP